MNLKLVKLQSLVSGLLSLILAAEWSYGEFAWRELRQSLEYSSDDSGEAAELPALAARKPAAEAYSELVERPLFIEGRKPLVEVNPTADVQNVETGQIDDWSLIGVYNKDKRPIALFSKKNEARKYLKLGSEQTISGWQIKEIQSDRVILQQGGQQKSVMLRKPRAETKSPVPPRPVAPPKPPRPALQPNNPTPENVNDDSQTN